ncbi:MAG: tetratricopeptide repeat protein [Promethearchaeota archaeon]
MPRRKEIIVFDANFFICMISIKAQSILTNLNKAAKNLSFQYFISETVFNEIKAPATFKNRLKQIVNIEKTSPKEIDTIKVDLNQYNIRFPAQDPDLSLIVLAKRLLDEDSSVKVHLVTDDFKLVNNSNLIFKGTINILSLSSFILKIQRNISVAQLRRYFKDIWKRSLNYTLSYIIERSKVYPAERKIQWLISRAVSVTENSIVSQDIEIENPEGVVFEIGASKHAQEIKISEKYIENQNLPASEEEKVQNIINFLENLKISREYIVHAREAIVKNNSKSAVSFLKKGNGFLISLLQIASGQLKKMEDYEIVQQLICSEISKMEFLRSFLLVSLGRISAAIDSLERAALFSIIIHNFKTCLTLNYLKALILLFHGLYKQSINAYNFVEELAEIYNDKKLKLKCAIGKAIAIYLQGDNRSTAMAIMEEISNMDLEKNFLDAIIVFSELGDYFLALGHSQIAVNLYNQALEISIDYKLSFKSEILIEKLKRAYIATVLNGYSAEDMTEKLDILLNKAYSVKDVEKYNEQIKKISSFNKLFYTKFPYLSGKRKVISYSKLPKELRDEYLEVVKFEKIDEKKNQILFIVSHYELGLLGIKIMTDENIVGIAENYSLKLTGKVKIYAPEAELMDVFLIRAVIEVVEKNKCEIVYTLPSFFKKLNL